MTVLAVLFFALTTAYPTGAGLCNVPTMASYSTDLAVMLGHNGARSFQVATGNGDANVTIDQQSVVLATADTSIIRGWLFQVVGAQWAYSAGLGDHAPASCSADVASSNSFNTHAHAGSSPTVTLHITAASGAVSVTGVIFVSDENGAETWYYVQAQSSATPVSAYSPTSAWPTPSSDWTCSQQQTQCAALVPTGFVWIMDTVEQTTAPPTPPSGVWGSQTTWGGSPYTTVPGQGSASGQSNQWATTWEGSPYTTVPGQGSAPGQSNQWATTWEGSPYTTVPGQASWAPWSTTWFQSPTSLSCGGRCGVQFQVSSSLSNDALGQALSSHLGGRKVYVYTTASGAVVANVGALPGDSAATISASSLQMQVLSTPGVSSASVVGGAGGAGQRGDVATFGNVAAATQQCSYALFMLVGVALALQ